MKVDGLFLHYAHEGQLGRRFALIDPLVSVFKKYQTDVSRCLRKPYGITLFD